MKRASDYRVHAQECRALAAQLKPGEQREQLLNMAEVWERLAQERSKLVRNHPELEQTPEEGSSQSEEVVAAATF